MNIAVSKLTDFETGYFNANGLPALSLHDEVIEQQVLHDGLSLFIVHYLLQLLEGFLA